MCFFSSFYRSNLNDLDGITQKLKERLYVSPLSQTEPVITTVQSGINTQSNNEPEEQFSGTDPSFQSEHYYRNQDSGDQQASISSTLHSSGQFVSTQLTMQQDSSGLPQYHRVENDTSTYSQTLRNAQDTLSTAQNLIANLNQATDQLSDRFTSQTQPHEPKPQFPRPSQGIHVHFANEAPTILSGELPNTSHSVYTESGLLSEVINGEAVFSAQNGMDQDTSGQEYFQQNWQEGSEEEDNVDSEDEVVMPKPLNDVSSANFANYASLHEGNGRSKTVVDEGHQKENQSIIEEQDSWFSGQHNSSKPELYDTIEECKDHTTGDDVDDILIKYGVDPNDYAEEAVDVYPRHGQVAEGEGTDDMVASQPDQERLSDEALNGNQSEESGKHVYAFQSLATKYQEPSDHEQEVDLDALLRKNQEFIDDQKVLLQEDPTSLKQVSRSAHGSSRSGVEHARGQKGVRKNAEFRHKYRHHRHTTFSSDSEEEEPPDLKSQRRKPSPVRKRDHRAAERMEQERPSEGLPVVDPGDDRGVESGQEDLNPADIPPQEKMLTEGPVDRHSSTAQGDSPEGFGGAGAAVISDLSEDEPCGEFNPMMRTQKTIQIVWDDQKHVKRATGVDFDEGSTATYQSSQAESEQGEQERMGTGQHMNGQQGGQRETDSSQEQFTGTVWLVKCKV